MSTGCQKERQRDRQTARQTDRKKDKDFSAYSSKQKLFRMSMDVRKIEDRKTERLFSLVIRTKVVRNVNRM